MPMDASKLLHVCYPEAVEIARQLNTPGAVNPNKLVAVGVSFPIAMEIGRQMNAGVGNQKRLLEACQFSVPDAITLAAAITAAGVH